MVAAATQDATPIDRHARVVHLTMLHTGRPHAPAATSVDTKRTPISVQMIEIARFFYYSQAKIKNGFDLRLFLVFILSQKGKIMSKLEKATFSQRWSALQPSKTVLVWACLGSVAATMVLGFTWGGWVTGGTAREMAEDAGASSRYELASVICVEKFLNADDARAELTTFQAIKSSYKQREFIEAGGWAVMPSKDKAARQSADLCAKVLANLDPAELSVPAVEAAVTEPAAVVQ
ncbi:MAG: hypothetical protein KDG49_11420 [Geminicoccaceae bacterium]|jgi:hypothetical protein|nr:hypothetical protein [Geminicoccaceae bacterium]